MGRLGMLDYQRLRRNGRKRVILRGPGLILGLAVAGCAASRRLPPSAELPSPPATAPTTVTAGGQSGPSAEPLGSQMLRVEPELKDLRFNVVLGFEADSDGVFVLSEPARGMLTSEQAHTGRFSVSLPAGTRNMSFDLPALLSGRPFPGGWTHVGAYLLVQERARVQAAYIVDGKVLASHGQVLPAGKWTAVQMDISHVPPSPSPLGQLALTFDAAPASPFWCDDVFLLDNTRVLVDGGENGWRIRRQGSEWTIDRPGYFKLSLKTPEAAVDGWALEEFSPIRARLRSERGKEWMIYFDGRRYVDGRYDPTLIRTDVHNDVYEQQHLSPAELSVPEAMGRIRRNTPGDRNNDGYNELTGAYQLLAHGPRLQVRLNPRRSPLVRPVLEVAGLPPGRVLITVEGQLIDLAARLPDGRLLIELPLRIERPVTVDLRVK